MSVLYVNREVKTGVTYWFLVNYVMILFDDRFFGSPEREAVIDNALKEMKRSSILDWKRILAKFEKML